eukprot:TRINITY_DN14094_c0_g1_i1.p1 TRINITY_DN14094_c0_g1~~TRINITY_DN14094_c0_g1_i1.p1  ORF type:complete len:386 (+),score=93.41 TRINITY_DN14094_c0_g1_i1:79-1236(+)
MPCTRRPCPAAPRRYPVMLSNVVRWWRRDGGYPRRPQSAPAAHADPAEEVPAAPQRPGCGGSVQFAAPIGEDERLGLILGRRPCGLVVCQVLSESPFAACRAKHFAGWRLSAFCGSRVGSSECLRSLFSKERELQLPGPGSAEGAAPRRRWHATLSLDTGFAPQAPAADAGSAAACFVMHRSSQTQQWGFALKELTAACTVLSWVGGSGLAASAGMRAVLHWRITRIEPVPVAEESSGTAPMTCAQMREVLNGHNAVQVYLEPLDLSALPVEVLWDFLQSLPELDPEHHDALMRLSDIKADRECSKQAAIGRLRPAEGGLFPAGADPGCCVCLGTLWRARGQEDTDNVGAPVSLICGHTLHRRCAEACIEASPAAPRCPLCRDEI